MSTKISEEEKTLYEILERECGYFCFRTIEGRGLCCLARMVYTTGILYGVDTWSYKGRYCYHTDVEAMLALYGWTGEGDPSGNWIVNKGERGGDRQNPNYKNRRRES